LVEQKYYPAAIGPSSTNILSCLSHLPIWITIALRDTARNIRKKTPTIPVDIVTKNINIRYILSIVQRLGLMGANQLCYCFEFK